MRGVRASIAIAVAAVAAVATVQLARVDAGVGSAFGPDRLQGVLDATPSPATTRIAEAREILDARPIDGRAYRVLALAEGRDALLPIANARWPRDALTRATLADRALANGQVDVGLEHLDALFRTHPGTTSIMLPLLVRYLGDLRVRDALVERLAQDPPWRNAMLGALRSEAAPAGDADALLVALAQRVPPDEEALRTRIAVLDRAGRPVEARAAWIASLPADDRAFARQVFDGGFERPGIAETYAWRFDDVPGVVIHYANDEPRTGASALSIEFDDRAVPFSAVRQSLALAPGRWRLEAAARDNVDNTRPFEWRIACRDGVELARMPLLREGQWRTQSMHFDVPVGCASQSLVLVHAARSLGERRLRGRLLIDDVGIFLD